MMTTPSAASSRFLTLYPAYMILLWYHACERIYDGESWKYEGRPLRKVSLRASDDRVDVSRIARVAGGGGHRQAAGFTTAMEWPELVEFLREEVAQQLS